MLDLQRIPVMAGREFDDIEEDFFRRGDELAEQSGEPEDFRDLDDGMPVSPSASRRFVTGVQNAALAVRVLRRLRNSDS